MPMVIQVKLRSRRRSGTAWGFIAVVMRLVSDAQIRFLDVGVAEQLLAGPLEDHPPLLHDVRPVNEAEGRVHVLLHEEDRHAALPEALEGLERPARGGRR